jgi:DNA-binding IclR family transcriptional regulator/GrpB-like predicted nucleotidyltransferase (UPF0157 family)
MPPRARNVDEGSDGAGPAGSIPSLLDPRNSQLLKVSLAILECLSPADPALKLISLPEHAHDYLEELHKHGSYTVSLAVLDGTEVVFVDRVPSWGRGQDKIDLNLQPGSRLPAYCTAMGKILLADLPEPELDELLAQMKLTKRGPNTITSKSALRQELEQVRKEAFAVNDQELAPELHSIAAPIRNDSEVAAAINIAAHTSMISLEELVDALGPHLISTADRISASWATAVRTRSSRNSDASISDEVVQIVHYDPDWPACFSAEHALLTAAIGDWAVGGIHHVGSTSVSGLAAKPIIDILVGVRSLGESRACFDRLARLDYRYAPYRPLEMHWFCKPDPSRRTHQLHLVPADTPRFRDELAFRDYLREHHDVAKEYAALKRRLAGKFEHDREAYTDAKTGFILATVRRALDDARDA